MKNKSIIFSLLTLFLITLLFSFSISARSGAEAYYKDISAETWGSNEIEYCFEYGYMYGEEDGIFSPNHGLTRGMMTYILQSISADSYGNDPSVFKDVDSHSQYEPYINWAYSEGFLNDIVTGELFYPEKAVTRQEFITFLYRLNQSYGHGENISDSVNSVEAFSDNIKIASYAIEAFEWALDNNLISGFADNTIRPDTVITKQNAAVIIYKYDRYYGHNWQLNVLQDRSCTVNGLNKLICSNCNAVRSVALKAYHIYEDETIKELSCLEDGVVRSSCRNCDYFYDTVIECKGSHNLDNGIILKNATGTEDGARKYTCTVCGGSFTQPIDAHTHSWGKAVITKNATATENGTKKFTCTICGGTYTQVIKAHTHSWGKAVITKNATATENGTKKFTCTICGGTYTQVIKAHTHSWGKAVITKNATATENGTKKFTCTICGGTYTQVIKAHTHNWGKAVITKNATATENGTKKSTCTICGGTYTQVIKAHTHNWGKAVITKNATATKNGTKKFTCTICGGTYTQVIKAHTHSWGKAVITKNATATENGTKKFTCTICGGSYTQAIKAHNHIWNKGIVTKKATCSTEGTIKFSCKICNGSYTKKLQKTSHNWNNGVVVTAATTSSNGTIKYTCLNCKATKTESYATNTHIWKIDRIIAPTQNEKGYTLNRCSLCSATKKDSYTDRLPRTEGYDSNGDGILTFDEYFGAFGMVDMLTENKDDYVGTPYVPLKAYMKEPYMLIHNKGQYPDSAGMNCTGFVASAVYRSGGNLDKVSQIYNGAYGNGYNWLNTIFNSGIKYYKFYSIEAALNSGLMKKGDIMFFVPPQEVPAGEIKDCHFGIFWGDTPYHDQIWHSTCQTKHNYDSGVRGQQNQITKISSGTLFDYILVMPLQH